MSEMNEAECVNVAVKVKSTSDGLIRRFRLVEVPGEDLFGTLMSQLRVLFGDKTTGRVTYVDCDGDVILIMSTAELLEAIRLAPSLLTIQWKEERCETKKASDVSMKQEDESHPECEEKSGKLGHGRGFGRGRGCRGRGRMWTEGEARWEGEVDCAKRFEKKKQRIEEKLLILKERDDPEGKWARKIEKLQKKLDFLELKKEFVMKKKEERASCGQLKKNLRKQECLQHRLSNIREAKVRVEKKQEEVRMRLNQLEAGDGLGNREVKMERLREHLAKLEQRHGFLIAREREVEGLLEECSVSVDGGLQEKLDCGAGHPQPWKRRNVQWDDGDCHASEFPPLDAVHFAKD